MASQSNHNIESVVDQISAYTMHPLIAAHTQLHRVKVDARDVPTKDASYTPARTVGIQGAGAQPDSKP